MKSLLFLFFFIGLSLSLYAQKPDCKLIHEGKFRIVDSLSGITIITRTKDFQVEENSGMGVKMIFDIKWIDDCTYELRPKEVVKGNQALVGNKGDFMTTHVKEVKINSYICVTTANFADFIKEWEVEMLKQ